MIDPAYAEQDRLEVAALLRDPVPAKPYFPPEWRILMMQPGDESLPRKMWMFWENGTLPSLNNISIRQWRHLNPDWNLTLLDGKGVRKTFPDLAKLFYQIPRTVQLRSDMLRLWLLAEYGGVWIDASALPLKPLDSFITKLVRPAGFWTFYFPPEIKGHVTTWFMAAQPKNPLVLRWRDAFMTKWKEPHYEFAYFELHHTLEDLVQAPKRDKKLMTVWDRMPKVTQSWPQACLRGCSDFWNVTTPEERTPILKRPFQKQRTIPRKWWAGYWEYMDSYQALLNKSAAARSDFQQVGLKQPQVVGSSSQEVLNTSSRAENTSQATSARSPGQKKHFRVPKKARK